MRRPGDEEHNEHEELFGEYPALLTDLKVEPRAVERDPARDEPAASGGDRPKRRWRFRLRRRRHGAQEPETVAAVPGQREPEQAEPVLDEGPIEEPVEAAPKEKDEPTWRPRKRRLRKPRIGARIRAALEAAERQAETSAQVHQPHPGEVALGTEEPRSEEHGTREPAAEEADEGAVERPTSKREELPARELAVEEPLTVEPVAEEPALEEPEQDVVELSKRERRRHARPRKQVRPQRRYLRSRVRLVRWLGFLLVAAAVGSVAPQVLPRGADEDAPDDTAPVPAPPDQRVVAWIVHGVDGEVFITLLASGERRPLALAIPSNLTITVPGQSLGTLEEAAATGDQGLVQVALQNVLGVPMDAAITSDLGTLSGMVDAVGGVEVADNILDGEAAVAYLHPVQAIPLPDEPFLRWQDVLEGLMDAVAARPEAAAAFPTEIETGMTAALPDPPDLVALPVIDFGAGVLRVDREGLTDLVRRRFVVTNGADAIRLVVLNGVGTPGIGEDVAQILVPEGYLLVSSQNANTFELEETRIIASSQEDVPAAERARELLGAGRVYLGNQPGLADVTVVVGRDFGGS